MTPKEIVELVGQIYAQPQFSHYAVKPATLQAYRDELDDLPIPLAVAQAAVRSLLLDDDMRLPTPQGVRKRVLREAGFLAPSWPQAKTMIDGYIEAYASDAELPVLPGPVQEALDARGGAYAARDADNPSAWFAQLRDTYKDCASRHDLFVSEPGGLAALAEVIAWHEAVAARAELLRKARRAAALLSEPFTALAVPSAQVPDPELQRIVSEAESRFGPLDQLDDGEDRSADLASLLDRMRGLGRG